MFLICKAILYSWLILLTFRLYISAFILTYGKDRFHWFLPFDPIMNYAFLTFPFFDPYILLAGSFTPLYCLAVDYAIYFKADERSIGFFHDFIYKNGDQFWQLNSTLFNSSSDSFVLTVSRTIASCKLIWRVLIYFYAAFYLYLKVRPHLKAGSGSPVGAQLVVPLELALVVYSAWNANRMGLFGVHYYLTPTLVIGEHLRLLGRQVAAALPDRHFRWQKRLTGGGGGGGGGSTFSSTQTSLSPAPVPPPGECVASSGLARALAHFRAEHTTTLAQLEHINANVASGFLLAAAASQLPVNLWLVSSLLFKRTGSRGTQHFTLAMIAIQLYLGGAIRGVLGRLTASLYRPATRRHLLRAQAALKVAVVAMEERMPGARRSLEEQVFRLGLQYGATVRAKLKLAAYLELLHTDRPFCFTMGPLGKFSKRGLYEFALFYSAYLMTFFKMAM
ncbi:hypothetical protein TYRP_021234, partial [Tyrophagus putrescentiae]